jgi:hypothetical protein
MAGPLGGEDIPLASRLAQLPEFVEVARPIPTYSGVYDHRDLRPAQPTQRSSTR